MEVIKKRKRHNFKWNKYKAMILVCSIMFIYGFFVVSNSLPKFIKDKSSFSIYFSKKPFNFKIKGKNYTFYLNYKVIESVKSFNRKVTKKAKNICYYIKDFFYNIVVKIRSYILNFKESKFNMFIITNVKS